MASLNKTNFTLSEAIGYAVEIAAVVDLIVVVVVVVVQFVCLVFYNACMLGASGLQGGGGGLLFRYEPWL